MDEMIFSLLRLTERAEQKIARLNERLERIAEYAFGDTWRQIDCMLDVIEKKRRLESALEIRNKLVRGLTEEEYVLLRSRARGVVPEILSGGRGYSERSIRRKTAEAVKAAENILFLLGCDREDLEKKCGKAPCDDAA